MTQQVKFDIGELIRAADVANIPTSAIPSDANPWTWKDPRAQIWQIAYRSINAANAQALGAVLTPADRKSVTRTYNIVEGRPSLMADLLRVGQAFIATRRCQWWSPFDSAVALHLSWSLIQLKKRFSGDSFSG